MEFDGQEVLIPWRKRAWHWLVGLVSHRVRQMTVVEYELRQANERLTNYLADRDTEIRQQRTEVERLRETITVKDVAIKQLAEVVERDRARIAAETAEYERRAAEASTHGR